MPTWRRSSHRELSCEIFSPIDLIGPGRFENSIDSIEFRRVIRLHCNQNRPGTNLLLDSFPRVFWNPDASQRTGPAGESADNTPDSGSAECCNNRAGNSEWSQYRCRE